MNKTHNFVFKVIANYIYENTTVNIFAKALTKRNVSWKIQPYLPSFQYNRKHKNNKELCLLIVIFIFTEMHTGNPTIYIIMLKFMSL